MSLDDRQESISFARDEHLAQRIRRVEDELRDQEPSVRELGEVSRILDPYANHHPEAPPRRIDVQLQLDEHRAVA